MPAPVFATGDVPTAAQVNSWFVNVLFAQKSASQSVTNSTAFVDDAHLTVPVEANCSYDLALVLSIDASPVADFKFQLVNPAGSSVVGAIVGLATTAAATTDDFTTNWAGSANLGGAGVGSGGATYARGILTTAGTAGTCKLQWAQLTANAFATQVLLGSYMLLRRVS